MVHNGILIETIGISVMDSIGLLLFFFCCSDFLTFNMPTEKLALLWFPR